MHIIGRDCGELTWSKFVYSEAYPGTASSLALQVFSSSEFWQQPHIIYQYLHLCTLCRIKYTSYLTFFLQRQNFGLNFSPHRKCVNWDKTGFATIQRKLQQNRFCKKTVEKRSHIKIILSIYLT